MQTMEEMVKTYYKEDNKQKVKLNRKIGKIEKRIQKLASKGGLKCFDSCHGFNNCDIEEIAQIFRNHGYWASADSWLGGLYIRWERPKEIKQKVY